MLLAASILLAATPAAVEAPPAPAPPLNVVLVMTDDQGWGDASCYGAEKIRTPRLDALAKQGMRFTDWHSPSPVCTPSRAGLLTGSLPVRVGLAKSVLFPKSQTGLNPSEVTLAEILKARGYATACIGKWHLGDNPAFMPPRHGFDYWMGIPYSHDMTPRVLQQNAQVLEPKADPTTLTHRYTDAAIAFIEQHRSGPFFVYLPHSLPHLPVAVSAAFRDKSPAGLYGDAVEEIDYEMGRLLDTLDRLELSGRTVVMFTSDNGPWKKREGTKQSKDNGGEPAPGFLGSAGPFRGSKGMVWDGGHRVPCIWRLPGTIPAGTVGDIPAMHIDALPTIAALCGGVLPTDRVIDGSDLGSALRGSPDPSLAERPLYHYTHDGIFAAVRKGPWKLHLDSGALYNLAKEPGEETDAASANPGVVSALRQLADAHAADIAAHSRPVGRIGKPAK
ncbi:MAG: sulfatase [Planctomycetes bacterium]|nr:sulfatase [Planctomycetota bacterium]